MGKNIKIFFDKNTWSDIARLPENQMQLLLEQAKLAQKSNGLSIYFSPVNLFELFKSAEDDRTFKLCQKELKIAARLTNVHLLEDPWNHVTRGTAPLVGLEMLEINPSFLISIKALVDATDYSQIEPWINELKPKIVNFQKSWLALTKETVKQVKGMLSVLDSKKKAKFFSENYRRERLKVLWDSFKEHFRLQESQFTKVDWSVAYSEVPSFRYWSQIQIRYMDKFLLTDSQPIESDYFDIEQTIYFDMIDYLISDDKKFRTLVEETNEPELQGRILRVEEFIQNILTLQKRAVCNSSSKWVGLSEKT